jgi:hypothetical protein
LRKLVIVLVVVFLGVGGVAFAAWRIMDDGDAKQEDSTALQGNTFQSELEQATESDIDAGSSAAGQQDAEAADTGSAGEVDNSQSGEDFSYTSPDQRYVTETQRHQNFFKAVAEGKVQRLEVINVDYRPVDDPDTSYVYFTITSNGGTSNATMVFKYEDSLWRIAAINQLQGILQGGTNYMVPASFEDALAREIVELQPFLTKVAEGKFNYMAVDSVSRPAENESILTGVVVGKSGKTVPAEMRLRKDYGIWHLTYVTNPS